MFTDTHVRRADGPFEQQIVLSMVAILAFFFMVYLRRLMPAKILRMASAACIRLEPWLHLGQRCSR